MAVWDALRQRLPGSIGIRDGFGFSVGETQDLPVCAITREGEERWTRGGAGVASTKYICLKDNTDTFAWTATATVAGVYTDENARDAIAAALVAGSNVTITVNDPANTIEIAATGGGGGGSTSLADVLMLGGM